MTSRDMSKSCSFVGTIRWVITKTRDVPLFFIIRTLPYDLAKVIPNEMRDNKNEFHILENRETDVT